MAWLRIPPYRPLTSGWWFTSHTASQSQLTSTQTRLGVVFQMPRSGIIEKLAFRISSVTTAEDLSIGLYTVGSDGNPTTTNYGGSQSAILPASQVTTGIKEVTLPTSAQATAGDIVSFVVEWASTPGNVTLRYTAFDAKLPHLSRYSSGSWVKESSYIFQSAMGYSDGVYVVAGSPVLIDINYAFNINSLPDERGTLYQFPFGIRFRQVYVHAPESGAYDVVVYLGNDSYSVSVPTYTTMTGYRGSFLILPELMEVPANTPFRITVKPTTTTNVTFLWGIQFPNVGYKDAYLNGTSLDYVVAATQRTDGGTWTDDNTSFHAVMPLITEVETTAVGAGGFPFPPHVIIT